MALPFSFLFSTVLPLILVAGFLGAGKTTFLKKLLLDARARQLRTAVIVNEFGVVDIDGALLRAAQVDELASIAGGCACCAGQEEFLAVLGEIATRAERPDYVIIEASGLADPVSILENLAAPPFNQVVRVAHIVCIADASNAQALNGTQQPLLKRQVELADVVVLNKTDLADESSMDAMQSVLNDWNRSVTIQHAVEGEIDFDVLWGKGADYQIASAETSKGPAHLEAHTLFCPISHPAERATLETQLHTLSDDVWRAKGFVRLRSESGLFLVQWSAGRGEITPFYAPFGDDEPPLGLVFIGAQLNSAQLLRQFGGHALMGMF